MDCSWETRLLGSAGIPFLALPFSNAHQSEKAKQDHVPGPYLETEPRMQIIPNKEFKVSGQ